jgi:hypothetical protein
MNTVEQIHDITVKLPDDYQEVVLTYVEELYELYSDPEAARQRRESDRYVQELILERLVEHRSNPKPGKPLADVLNELRQKHNV